MIFLTITEVSRLALCSKALLSIQRNNWKYAKLSNVITFKGSSDLAYQDFVLKVSIFILLYKIKTF